MVNSEAQRIRDEYKRRAKEIPEDFYSHAKPANFFIYTQRTRAVLATLVKEGILPLHQGQVLEIGCGAGHWLLDFLQWGADPEHLAAMDLDENRLNIAKRRLPLSDLRVGDASRLPWPDKSFDIVLQSTVFTSILDDRMKKAIAREMIRVLKPDGLILWYDFFVNNPRNPNVKGIKLKEIRNLFPGFTMNVRKVTLAPPLARLIAPRSWLLCHLLEMIPWLLTHYLISMQRQK